MKYETMIVNQFQWKCIARATSDFIAALGIVLQFHFTWDFVFCSFIFLSLFISSKKEKSNDWMQIYELEWKYLFLVLFI